MSKRNKLQKFAELLALPNVYENFNPLEPKLYGLNGALVSMKGEWASKHFGNDQPITLELACGRGEYTLGLARQNPRRNFMGVDVKGARIWRGAKIALEEGLANAAFLRLRIEQLSRFFEAGEVSEIWITFPDPFLRNSKASRRLTAPRFLAEYKKVLAPGGLIHLKTYEPNFFSFTLEALAKYPGAEILHQDEDIYSKPLPIPELELKTYYERIHLQEGKAIKYVRFRLNG